MAWYNSSWTKRKPITLTGGASGAQTAYQTKFTVTFDSDMKVDFSDLRFTKADGTTLLDAWMESHTASTSAIIWVETDTPANTVTGDIYMYYGNSGAASAWSISGTFLKSDDFEDGDTTDAGDFFVTSSNYASTTQKKRGSYSSLIPYDSGGNYQLLKSTAIGGALDAVMIEADVYINTVTGRVCTAMVTDTAGDTQGYSGAYLKFEGGVIYQYSGGYNDTGVTYTTGWHKFGILQNANDFDLYFDTQSALSITNYNSGQTDIDKFSIGDANNPSGTYVDDVRVRKYVVNPATYAFGSEESSPGWTGKIIGVTNPAKVFGIAVANISKIMGV